MVLYGQIVVVRHVKSCLNDDLNASKALTRWQMTDLIPKLGAPLLYNDFVVVYRSSVYDLALSLEPLSQAISQSSLNRAKRRDVYRPKGEGMRAASCWLGSTSYRKSCSP